MENMQLDMMEIKDIEVDGTSVQPTKKMKIFAEHPPVISDQEGMFYYLEYHQDDIRLIMEIVRKATLEFTPNQKYLIGKMEGEFAAWCASNETRDTYDFESYVIELKEDLAEREIEDPEFCEEQGLKYAYIHKIFEKSSFPYSEKQLNLLELIKHDIELASGNLSDMHDMGLLEKFKEFLELMKAKDHVNTNKFYVECTVEYYVQDIVDELYYAEWDEITRRIPECFLDEPMINLATYVKKELNSAYIGVHYENFVSLFHLGLSEIYYRLIDIFKFTELLSDQQKELLTGIFKEIGKVERNPNTSKYEDLHLGFYGFMDSLRRDHQKRETKVVDGYKVTDEDGIIAKKVQKIVKELIELEDAERTHHETFSEYSSMISEITNKMLRHFRRIYPENYAEPVTVVLPNGYYNSILLYEWLNPA